MWVLQLELPNAVGEVGERLDRQTLLRQYARQVISITSDQGVEFGFGSLPQLETNHMVHEAAATLQTRPSLFDALQDETQLDANCELQLQCQSDNIQVRQEGSDPLHFFCNAFHVAGIKHVSDNSLKSVTASMKCWEPLLGQLKGIEKLLSRVQYRERLCAVCMPEGHPETSVVEAFNAKLGGLRWEVVVEFCLQLLDIQDHLRRHWDLDLFLRGAAGHGRWTLAADFTEADSAIRSSVFWGRVGVISQITFGCEFIGRWAGGCPCHEPMTTFHDVSKPNRPLGAKDSDFKCVRKGCRAAELACGQGLQTQLRLMSQQCGLIQCHFSRIVDDRTAQDELHADWATARSRLFGALLLLIQTVLLAVSVLYACVFILKGK